MKLSTNSAVPVYTIAGSSTARPLPDWLIRKRKRSLKQDPEFANRIELLQDFEFEEASSCVRVTEDGNWVMSTGTYKPQIHVHHLPQLSLSFARHTDALNETFILLSSDYSKSLHLQSDRFLEFHTPGGCHYKTRIPRYGRGLAYDRRSAEALIPAVGLNEEGSGEVFRLNIEQGRFMKGYEVDVGGDDTSTVGANALQGGIHTGSVNSAAVAEESHNLLAFGTSIGTVEFWDPRSKNRAGILSIPQYQTFDGGTAGVTALQFQRSGLNLATGSSDGIIHLYDLRSPIPTLKKDQGYGYPIQNLIFLESTSRTRSQTSELKILSSDKRIIKIWDPLDGTPWTSVEPAVDLHHVEWCRDSGMLLTANEGKQQHSFFIPQLGPAPKWCAFLDNLVEEMAEDPNDPQSFSSTSRKAGEVYDNYKFLTHAQLRQLNMDHLIGKTGLLRPYMHGFFVNQNLYEEAVLINNPTLWEEQRAKSIKEKVDKERESRIRGKKKVQVKVNRKLAERILEREEKNERRKAKRMLAKAGGSDEEMPDEPTTTIVEAGGEKGSGEDTVKEKKRRPDLLQDPRFASLFQDEAFAIDERSHEFRSLNPSTKVPDLDAEDKKQSRLPKGLTAAEMEDMEETRRHSDSDDSGSSSDDDEDFTARRKPDEDDFVSSHQRKKNFSQQKQHQQQHQQHQQQPRMRVSASSSSNQNTTRSHDTRAGSNGVSKSRSSRDISFGSRATGLSDRPRNPRTSSSRFGGGAVGEKEISFVPAKKERGGGGYDRPEKSERGGGGRGGRGGRGGADRGGKQDRRSASGNVFRNM